MPLNTRVLAKLREATEADRFPPSFHSHPVVEAHPDEAVLPLSLFIDAVPYSVTDSIIGFWLINMLTARRHFLWAQKEGAL